MLLQIRNYTALLWFGAALLLAFAVVEIADEALDESHPTAFDVFVLQTIAEFRTPLLTMLFINFTALGSTTLIGLHTAMAFALLMTSGDRTGAWQLSLASVGAIGLTELMKAFIDRPRPSVVPALVEAFGGSYPSGHSLAAAAMYATIAILALRHLAKHSQRIALMVFTLFVIIGVGLSRVYLGVHYVTDAVSGMLLGISWALILAGAVAVTEQRRSYSLRNDSMSPSHLP